MSTVQPLDPAAREDAELVEDLTALINDVYAVAERGLWQDGTTRTTTSEVADLIGAGEIVVATREGRVAGSVRLHDVSEDTSEFGLLVAAHEERGTGVGRDLLDFAEGRSRGRGRRAMQLELLMPRRLRHPNKEFLRSWYGRRGYRVIRSASIEDAHPSLAPLLATPCYFDVYEKPLAAASASSRSEQM